MRIPYSLLIAIPLLLTEVTPSSASPTPQAYNLALMEMDAVRDEVVGRLLKNSVPLHEALSAAEAGQEHRLRQMLDMSQVELRVLYRRLERAGEFRNQGPAWEPPPWAHTFEPDPSLQLPKYKCGEGYGSCVFVNFSLAGAGSLATTPAVALVLFGVGAYDCLCDHCTGDGLE